MKMRAIVSGLALAFALGFSASAATVSGASGADTAAAPAAIDMSLLSSFMNGRPLVVAQEVCVKAGDPCDDSHKCCKGLTCTKNLLDKQAICDFKG